jgi:hypothetical protein
MIQEAGMAASAWALPLRKALFASIKARYGLTAMKKRVIFFICLCRFLTKSLEISNNY